MEKLQMSWPLVSSSTHKMWLGHCIRRRQSLAWPADWTLIVNGGLTAAYICWTQPIKRADSS